MRILAAPCPSCSEQEMTYARLSAGRGPLMLTLELEPEYPGIPVDNRGFANLDNFHIVETVSTDWFFFCEACTAWHTDDDKLRTHAAEMLAELKEAADPDAWRRLWKGGFDGRLEICEYQLEVVPHDHDPFADQDWDPEFDITVFGTQVVVDGVIGAKLVAAEYANTRWGSEK